MDDRPPFPGRNYPELPPPPPLGDGPFSRMATGGIGDEHLEESGPAEFTRPADSAPSIPSAEAVVGANLGHETTEPDERGTTAGELAVAAASEAAEPAERTETDEMRRLAERQQTLRSVAERLNGELGEETIVSVDERLAGARERLTETETANPDELISPGVTGVEEMTRLLPTVNRLTVRSQT